MNADIDDLDLPAVEREITTLAGHLAAATCRYLELLAVFDSGGGWHGSGLRSCSQWLSWKCGLSTGTAREQLRVAHALGGLPRVREAFAAGRLSYSKARALTRVATAKDEQPLVDVATACTASQLDRLCAGIGRARTNEEVLDQAARASFRAHWEPDGSLRFDGRLSAEDGAVLLAALAAVRPDPVADPGAPHADDTAEGVDRRRGVRRTDAARAAAHSDAAALVLLASHALTVPPTSDSAAPIRLVVHAAADASAEAPAPPVSADTPTAAVLDAGPTVPLVPLGPDTARRLACEALVEPAAHPDAAATPPVQHRFATARQRRALLVRDGGCAFPGCVRRRALHAHHLQPWSEGGTTTMANLVLTCSHHHRLIHEGGWQLRSGPDHRWQAVRPDGTIVTAAPATRGAATALPSAHRADIQPETVTGTWTGEPLELAYAVSVFV